MHTNLPMTKVLRVDTHGKVQDVGRGGLGHLQGGETTLDVRVAVIQALIPLGLQAVEELRCCKTR